MGQFFLLSTTNRFCVIDVVAAARSVLQVERDTENPDIRIVHQIKNSLAPTAEDIRFSISADKGFQWLECRPQSFENQKPDLFKGITTIRLQ